MIVNKWVEKTNQALVRSYDGLRIAEDNCRMDKKDFVDYENKVDVVIDRSHVIALCQYNLNICSTTEIIDVVSSHQFALIPSICSDKKKR
jgi:hypothetical protein